MNWNKIFWHIVGTALGSMICLLWLPFMHVVSIFIAIIISKILIEVFEQINNKHNKKQYNQDDLEEAHFSGKIGRKPFTEWFEQFKINRHVK